MLRELLGTVSRIQKFTIAVTGRKFRNELNFSSITELEAVELATGFILPADHSYRVVISAGGETTMVYHLDDDGKVDEIHTGNKCASGTGEFFLQQLGRMSITLSEVGGMELPEKPYNVSGRCSVFCKSDCTHALNKGIAKDRVVAGLSSMMAGKILELLKKLPDGHVMLVGGCTDNQIMVHYLQEAIADLYIPEQALVFEALGAALWAFANKTKPFQSLDNIFIKRLNEFATLEPLSNFREHVDFKYQERGVAREGDSLILGLDKLSSPILRDWPCRVFLQVD